MESIQNSLILPNPHLIKTKKSSKRILLKSTVRSQKLDDDEKMKEKRRFVLINLLKRKFKERLQLETRKGMIVLKHKRAKKKEAKIKEDKSSLTQRKGLNMGIDSLTERNKELKEVSQQVKNYELIFSVLEKRLNDIKEDTLKKTLKEKMKSNFVKPIEIKKKQVKRLKMSQFNLLWRKLSVAKSRSIKKERDSKLKESLLKQSKGKIQLAYYKNKFSHNFANSKIKTKAEPRRVKLSNVKSVSGFDKIKRIRERLKIYNLLAKSVGKKEESKIINKLNDGEIIHMYKQISSLMEKKKLFESQPVNERRDSINSSIYSESSENDNYNPRHSSLLESVMLGVGEMKKKVKLPKLTPYRKSVFSHKTQLNIGVFRHDFNTTVVEDIIDDSFMISKVTFYEDNQSIVGFRFVFRETETMKEENGELHGKETSTPETLVLKNNENIKNIYWYCKDEIPVSLRFTTVNHQIFNIGVDFNDIEDLENINCFEVGRGLVFSTIRSYIQKDHEGILGFHFSFK